jgi:hypothetical protein
MYMYYTVWQEISQETMHRSLLLEPGQSQGQEVRTRQQTTRRKFWRWREKRRKKKKKESSRNLRNVE